MPQRCPQQLEPLPHPPATPRLRLFQPPRLQYVFPRSHQTQRRRGSTQSQDSPQRLPDRLLRYPLIFSPMPRLGEVLLFLLNSLTPLARLLLSVRHGVPSSDLHPRLSSYSHILPNHPNDRSPRPHNKQSLSPTLSPCNHLSP